MQDIQSLPDSDWSRESLAGQAGSADLFRLRGRPALLLLRDTTGQLVFGSPSQFLCGLTDCVAAMVAADLEPPKPPVDRSLTVAICTKDRPELVARCLDGLHRAASADQFDILVVDNAPSGPRTRDIASAAGVGYAMEPKAGLDFARNRALAEAKTDWLAFVDDDAVVDAGWWEGLRGCWTREPDVKGVAGLVLPFALDTKAQMIFERDGGFGRGVLPRRFEPLVPGDPFHPCNSGRIGAGCNMAFERAFITSLGGFDEALDTGGPLPGGGDLDIFARVLHAGGSVAYEPQMIVRHEHRRTDAQLRRQYWSWGLGFMAFLDKTRGSNAALRPQVAALTRWWFGYVLRRLMKRMLRGEGPPAPMIVAELVGGIQGILGEYRRSVKRSEAIRRNG